MKQELRETKARLHQDESMKSTDWKKLELHRLRKEKLQLYEQLEAQTKKYNDLEERYYRLLTGVSFMVPMAFACGGLAWKLFL